jgi:cytochrome b561
MERSVRPEDRGYALPQIVLHWAIVALVIVQLASSDGMEAFWDRNENGPPGLPDGGAALLHAGSGALILVLMILRVVARLRYGAPPLPPDLPDLVSRLAHVNHYALYATLLLLPPTGVLALFVFTGAADIHELLKNLLLVLVALHVLGAAFHAFIRRDGVVWRILTPRGRQR